MIALGVSLASVPIWANGAGPLPPISSWFLATGTANLAGKWSDAIAWDALAEWFLNGGKALANGMWVDSMLWNPPFFLSTGTADLAGLWDDTQVWS